MKTDKNKEIVKEPEMAYLTSRTLERALSKATRNLTEDAMELMGYVVTVEDNWVVKKFKDGNVERIEEIEKVILKSSSQNSNHKEH